MCFKEDEVIFHFSFLFLFFWWGSFLLRPMPSSVCSRLCSKDSALTSVFMGSTRSSALSVFVVVSARYRQLLSFFFFFLASGHFFFFFFFCILTFEERSFGKLQTNMALIYLHLWLQGQSQTSLCLNQMSDSFLSCFGRNHILVVFALSFPCQWDRMPSSVTKSSFVLRFFCVYPFNDFDGLSKFVVLCMDYFENCFGFF